MLPFKRALLPPRHRQTSQSITSSTPTALCRRDAFLDAVEITFAPMGYFANFATVFHAVGTNCGRETINILRKACINALFLAAWKSGSFQIKVKDEEAIGATGMSISIRLISSVGLEWVWGIAKKKSGTTLRLELNDEVWDTLYDFRSSALERRPGRIICVRVVRQFGEESSKILTIE